METRVGTCSLCGGDVVGIRGAWWSINPPPPDTCSRCGGVSAADVIRMVRIEMPSNTTIKTITSSPR